MSSLFYWEIILILVYCIIAFWGITPFLSKWSTRIDGALERFYRNDWLLVLTPGLFSLLLSMTLSLLISWPEPRVHDEFSYLLAADTFSHGRLSNPPHSCWIFFETFHVLQQPFYLSKYPPGQGLFLALGQMLFHAPIAGVWLSLGLASSALAWMLRAWLSPREVFWVGGMAVVQFNVLGHMMPAAHYGYWGQSFWGGAVAALGGSLAYGAWGRLRFSPSWKNTTILGIGAILLANSRPYEGLLALLPIVVFSGRGLFFNPKMKRGDLGKHLILPLGICLTLLMAWMFIYNRAGTGTWWEMPFQKYEKTYAVAPLFLYAEQRTVPHYNHRVMNDFYVDQMLPLYQAQKHWSGFWLGVSEKTKILFEFYYNPLLFIPVVFFFLKGKKSDHCLFLVSAGIAAGFLSETWVLPHYAAPFCCLFYLGLAWGLRSMSGHVGWGQRFISSYPAILPALLLCAALLPLSSHLGIPSSSWRFIRSNIEKNLGENGKHLILVDYSSHHPAAAEWVYNKAEIDLSPVVWARSMGQEEDQRLIQYFKDRKVWILQPDQSPVRLIPVIP